MMNNFIFENKTKVYFGKGGVKEYLGGLLANFGETVMLAYGGGSIKCNGVYDEIMGILNAQGKCVVEFSGIMSNPTYAKVQDGAKLARENHVDLILAVGGGSVSDCCKVTSGAFDTLSHAMETYFGKPDENNLSDDINEAVMRSVIHNIRILLTDPENYDARSEAGVGVRHGRERRAEDRQGHGFSGASDPASAGRLHQSQPWSGPGGDPSRSVPPHLQVWCGAVHPLGAECLGYRTQGQ